MALLSRRFPLPGLLMLLAAGACSHRSGGQPTVGSAVIGPEGGTVEAQPGSLYGVRLEVPPGAVAEPTTFRIVDEFQPLPPGAVAATFGGPGRPFRIDPPDLVLDADCRLQLPYNPLQVGVTAPGNVRARQANQYATTEYEPLTVDVVTGLIAVDVHTLGSFVVVPGPQVGSLGEYQPLPGTTQDLDLGYSFAVEEVPAGSPYVGFGTRIWRIAGPGFDESLVVRGTQLIARESATPSWRETWATPVDLFQLPSQALGGTFTTDVSLEQPVGMPVTALGTMAAFAYRQYAEPRTVDGALVFDVVKLVCELSWMRPDIGDGQRSLVLWFAPGKGLLELRLDGQVLNRVP